MWKVVSAHASAYTYINLHQLGFFIGAWILAIRGRQVVNAGLGSEPSQQPEPGAPFDHLAELNGFAF